MTNRLELNWKLDGFVDEQRYYCSETAFTVETKPAPKAILDSDVRSYVDTDITEGLTYYVAISSVKNNVEKLSEIVSVKASDNVITTLKLVDNILDTKGRVWTSAITPVFTADGFQLNNNDLATAYTSDFDWVNNKYTIEAFVKASSWSTWSELGLVNGIPRLLGRMEKTNDSNYWSFGPVASGKVHFYYYQSGQKLLVASSGTIPVNELVHISFCKDDTRAYVSVGGVVNSVALPSISLPAASSNISLGRWNNQRISGICGGLRITKGEALYTANFTPPDRPF